ncbi:thiamine phosphate synthase [Oleispirillum naphthae]|uniref:thiamine phosphate synthase n=1 Tax=Oleispirillum naphthae TaxID=2838853 RepID=UPI0030824B8F
MRTITTVAFRLNARSGDARLPALLAMSDRARLPDPVPFLRRFPRRAALVFRGGDAARGWAARAACRRLGVPFFWAGAAAEARFLSADGLHLRDDAAARQREARAWRRHGGALLFAAAHGPRAVRAAAAAGADAVLLSPVFPTASHPGAPAIGISRFRAWARAAGVPVYALGGVTPKTARALVSTPCVGIAGIDWVLALRGA